MRAECQVACAVGRRRADLGLFYAEWVRESEWNHSGAVTMLIGDIAGFAA
jgi:hypothetical protein